MATAIQLDSDLITALESDLHAEMTEAEGSAATAMAKVREYRECLDLSNPPLPAFPGGSELVPPFVKESLFALQAELAPAILNPEPFLRCKYAGMPKQIEAYMQAVGIDPDMSRLWEAYLQMLVFEKMRARDTFKNAIYAGLRDGAAPLMTSWDTMLRTVPAWDVTEKYTVDPATGALIDSTKKRRRTTIKKTVYDYPRVDLIPLEHFIVYPNFDVDISTAELVGAKYNVSGHDMRVGSFLGDYDEAAVRKVLQYGQDSPDIEQPEDVLHGISANAGAGSSSDGRLTVFEGVRRIPGNRPDEPSADYWITYHWRSSTILRCVPLEEVVWTGERPFDVLRPYASIPGIRGDSVASSGAAFIQDAKMTLLRLGVDAAALGVAPPMLVSTTFYKKAEETINENRRPFGVIPFPDAYFNSGGKGMQPFVSGMDPRMIVSMNELLNDEGAKGSAANDTMKAAPMGTTATEAAQIFESSKKLVGYMLENCAQTVGDIGQRVYEFVKQYQDHDTLRELWERMSDTSDIPWEIAVQGEYVISANGIAETSNKQILFERSMQMMAIAEKDPVIWQDPESRWKVLHEVFTRMGVRKPEEFIKTLPEYQALSMQQQAQAVQSMLLQSGIMTPTGAPGAQEQPGAAMEGAMNAN